MIRTRPVALVLAFTLAVVSRGLCCCAFGARCADRGDTGASAAAAPSCCERPAPLHEGDAPGGDDSACRCPTLGPTLDTARALAAPDHDLRSVAPAALALAPLPPALALTRSDPGRVRPAPASFAGIPRVRSLLALGCLLTI